MSGKSEQEIDQFLVFTHDRCQDEIASLKSLVYMDDDTTWKQQAEHLQRRLDKPATPKSDEGESAEYLLGLHGPIGTVERLLKENDKSAARIAELEAQVRVEQRRRDENGERSEFHRARCYELEAIVKLRDEEIARRTRDSQLTARIIHDLRIATDASSARIALTVDAAFHALLEMSAWMGIPEDKRHAKIAHLMENVKYCATHDVAALQKSKGS